MDFQALMEVLVCMVLAVVEAGMAVMVLLVAVLLELLEPLIRVAVAVADFTRRTAGGAGGSGFCRHKNKYFSVHVTC
jgi:hypothetical protein